MNEGAEKIKNMICDEKIKLVSFDIFDTLILRPVFRPTYLFVIMDNDFLKLMPESQENFTIIRMAAEKSARLSSENGEVTIDDIYQEMSDNYNIEKSVAEKLKETEIQLEIKGCYARKTAKMLFDEAIKCGKKVVITSDMYLTEDIIKKILEKNGYTGYDRLFVSCVLNKNKCTGTMYHHILEEYKIDDLAYSESFRNNIPSWISKVRELTYSLKKMQESGNYSEEQINSRKQSILELGWNPEIEFSDKARSIAVETAKMRRSSVNIIDLREFDVNYTTPTEEDLNDKELYPIFIVLIAGNAFHSKLIRKFTRDDYSHAAFSLDPELNECFGFKILEANGTKRTGYHKEGMKDVFKPNNLNIGLFCFFVPKYIYIKFKDIIKHFDANMEKTKYSYASLLCYLLHIPVNVDYKYFCSQFVDVVFRKLDINITGKKSSTFVSPATLHKAALRNEKIFKLYEGSANDYDAEKIKAVINKTAKPLKESEQMYIKNQDMYINYLIENCNKLDTVLSLKEYSSIVTDPTMNNIINKMLFEPLDIYSETEMQNGIDIDSLIKKYIKPLC